MMVPRVVKKVSLITDGSCLGNPGPGGWACILRFGALKKELIGYDPHTTNNRMELMASIQGLLGLKEPCEPVQQPTPPAAERHRLPSGHVVRDKAVLGGLHHEYWLEKVVA